MAELTSPNCAPRSNPVQSPECSEAT